MPEFNLGYNGTTRVASLSLAPDARPASTANLGTVTHETGDIETLFHHVRDALYGRDAADPTQTANHPFNILDVHSIPIQFYGPGANADYVSAVAISVAALADATIVLKYQPQDVVVANAQFTYESADVDVATVSAAGVVSGVAAGSTWVTVTKINGDLSVVIPVTVTA